MLSLATHRTVMSSWVLRSCPVESFEVLRLGASRRHFVSCHFGLTLVACYICVSTSSLWSFPSRFLLGLLTWFVTYKSNKKPSKPLLSCSHIVKPAILVNKNVLRVVYVYIFLIILFLLFQNGLSTDIFLRTHTHTHTQNEWMNV